MSDRTITGRVVGEKYRITGLQRSGRMGDIYVGRRVDTNELVSIKMMDPALFGEKDAVRRFERETKITSRLDNPCTLVVQDFGRTGDGLPWMALEFVEGDQLNDVIGEGPIEPLRAAYIVAQIAMALSEAHGIGVVHRDLSPENVLITEAAGQHDSVKVLDFGLSRLQEGDDGPDEQSALTAVGVRIGNPVYMAPEYIDEHDLDWRADLYSLGILFFEMLTGSPPFTGRPYKVMDKHLNEPVPAPSSKASGVPGWIDALISQLTVKNPRERIQSADQVVKMIERGLGERLQTVQTVQAAPDAPAAQAPPQVVTPDPTDPEVALTQDDPGLLAFVDQQILQNRALSGAVDPAECFVVARVAATSIAARLGVEPGWLVHLPDEAGKGMLDPGFRLSPVAQRRYHLSSPDGAQKVEAVLSGADPGMDLVLSASHIRRYFTPTRDKPEPLLDVWRLGDWETLEKLAWRTLSQQRGAAGMLNTGLFARFLGKGEIKMREHPALLLYGAALVEQGKLKEGYELIFEYKSQYAAEWAPTFDAVAHYYAGLYAEGTKDMEQAGDMYVQSWLRWPTAQAAARIHAMTGRTPDTRAWYGRQFPDYSLDVVESKKQVYLYDTLARLDDDQILLVCMMGGFRGNLEYDEFMRTYLALNANFGRYLAGLHVVTHRTLRDKDKPEHYQGEDMVAHSGLYFHVLEDYRAFVQRTVKPFHVPTIYGVNREGWVVHEGRLDSVALWDMLSTGGQVRAQLAG